MLQRAIERTRAPAKVIAVSRFQGLRDRGVFAAAGIQTIPCDLSDPEALAALPDAASVYFLAGLKFGTAASPDLLRKMNVEVPHLVAKRFRRSRIVAFSTGCVYPFVATDTAGATEATPVGPVGSYAISCLGREDAFSEAARNYGTRVILLRLNYAVEFRYGVLVDIAEKVRNQEPVDLTMGHLNAIWQRDAVDQIIRTLSLAESPAVPLNITGPDVLKVRDLAQDFGRLFGRAPRFTGNEAPTAWLNDASRSHRLLGRPETSVATMTEWIAAWLQTDGPTWGKPTAFERRDGIF
jgi:nucleoside-diphosphate-sugar epimerase